VQVHAIFARVLFALLVVFQLSACGDPDRHRVPPSATGPSRLPLTDAPVAINLSTGTEGTKTVFVTFFGGADRKEVIAQDDFPMDRNGSFTIQGVNFDWVAGRNSDGTLSFVMNRAQYNAIKAPSGSPLTKILIDVGATANHNITSFDDGFFAFKQAYYYAFAFSSEGQETAPKFTYTADPVRLADTRKSWRFSTDAGYAEQCATYTDANKACTTDYAGTSEYFALGMPMRNALQVMSPGVYDVTVSLYDMVQQDSVGTYTTKLIVGKRPVAKLALMGPATSTVGSTLVFDARESVADQGSTIAYTLTKPAGSNATLLNEGTRNPSFVADVRGTYTVTLTVSFNGVVSTATVSRDVTPIVTGASGG
jgi:hypothetical protein